MKLTRKLLLSICCFALCAALLLGGTLVLLLSPKTPADTTVPEETDADTTAEQTEAVTEAETEPQTQKIDPAVQNQLLISAQDFVNPALQYRALKIEHNFLSLPGSTAEEKAQSLIDYGFGGAAVNMKWDANYLQQGYTLDQFAAFVKAANDQGVRIWLYDEYGYPSGAAGNLTVEGHPEYAAVRLVQYSMNGGDADTRTLTLPDDFVKIEYAYLLVDGESIPLEVHQGRRTFKRDNRKASHHRETVLYH